VFRGGDQQKPPVEAEENRVGLQLNQIHKRSGGANALPLLDMELGCLGGGSIRYSSKGSPKNSTLSAVGSR
jgi:hypothetical protein